MRHVLIGLAAVGILVVVPAISRAETGRDAWLRYQRLTGAPATRAAATPAAVVALGTAPTIASARDELARGILGMTGRALRVEPAIPVGGALVVGTAEAIAAADPAFAAALAGAPALPADGYRLRHVTARGSSYTLIAGGGPRGALYGAFAWLSRVALGQPLAPLDVRDAPAAPIRWVNEWNNLDGTIERGYGGRSIFWDNGQVRDDLTRVGEYGRLLASLGINGISINNVNANPRVLSSEFAPQIARIADAFRPWGVQVAIAVDFGSPQSLGKLETYDPLDPGVIAWWKGRFDELYRAVPDLGGVVLKADSEGRVGPSAYGRSHADAANVVARALAPHKGVIFYRGFVYDHRMDWRNPKNDRARAALDNFKPLDGQFDPNVIIQIKHGPIDFQVREPTSPLFGALERTNVALELQITQEYFGQGRHTVFLVPMWKTAMDFDLQVRGAGTPMKQIVAGKTFARPLGGFVGVSNVGLDDSWYGNHLSQANLYGYGRLAWNPDATAEAISRDWTRLTFGDDPVVSTVVNRIQLSSWQTYEHYTGPLGLQTLTDIVGNHFGVAVEASERNGWGQWHFADEKGVGMNRTVATGTGFVGQYSAAVAAGFETLARCPDDLVLFMHHVPYTHVLHSGRTVIQYIYDVHYDGAAAVDGYIRDWKTLKGKVDDDRYAAVLNQLDYQAGQAIVWRDAVNMWFFKTSGIADTKGRVGVFAGRIEAEAAQLSGYAAKPVTPWETASGATAVECGAAVCTATFGYSGAAGARDVTVRYFDTNNGASRFRVFIDDKQVDEWVANDRLPRTTRPDGTSSARRVLKGVTLRSGSTIRVEGIPDGAETAALDYVEISGAPALSPAPRGR